MADDCAECPETSAFKQTVLDCVRCHLVTLSQDRLEVLQLRFWGGLSVKETAVIMRKSEGAVKMLTSRAVADLKERCLTNE